MRYYEADERVYREMEKEGKRAWDELSDSGGTFENFLMRGFLEESLEAIGATAAGGRRVLEMGCGSGPISCYLAARGWRVRGVDVSETAIEMARRHAAERGVEVRFEVGDVCRMAGEGERYDLIVDGHCLHCLVWEEDRSRALSAVRGMMAAGGVFLVETMVGYEGMGVGEKYRLDEQGVLWLRVEEAGGVEGAVWDRGEWFIPYRRILRAEEVERELGEAGFVIQCRAVVEQGGAGKPRLMRVRCGVK